MLVFPPLAWAPEWETLSDTSIQILEVCTNGIRFEEAKGVSDHTGTTPLTEALGVHAGPVETGTNKPPTSAPLILNTTFQLPHQHFNVPTLPPDQSLRHYYALVTLLWTSTQTPGTPLRLVFEYPDTAGNVVDYPFDGAPQLLIGSCTLSTSAVALRAFTATRAGKSTLLRWRTASERGTLGFDVFREQSGRRVKVNRRLIKAAGRGASGASYAFRDARAARRYWLREVTDDGSRVWLGTATVS